MADKGPTKKVGPLPVWGWGAVGAGTYLAYYLYKSHANNVAAAQTTAANGTIGGTTSLLDPNVTGAASTSSVTTDPFQSWRSSVLSSLQAGGLSSSDSITALNDYLAGQPIPNAVSANVLKNVLGTIGLAPGYGYLPVQAAKTAAPVTTTHTPSETHVTTPNTPSRTVLPVAVTPAPTVRPKGGAAGPNLLTTPIPFNIGGRAVNSVTAPIKTPKVAAAPQRGTSRIVGLTASTPLGPILSFLGF